MIHRLAISIGGIVAAAVLAIGFAASGFGPSVAPADAQQPTVGVGQSSLQTTVPQATPTPITRVQTTTVYVRPAPKPKVIHVTKRAPAPAATKRPKVKVVHVTVPAKHSSDHERDDDGEDHGDDHGDDDGGQHERGDD